MGLFFQQVVEISKFILERGCKSICMIGVQNILIDVHNYNRVMRQMGYEIPEIYHRNSYEIFEKLPGVECVSALDFSDYEGADIVFDLNSNELPQEYKGKFDLVIDGGTLEHVFNQYNAINNMNALVKIGGYIYHMLPCAGWGNHSFYNYSPTFFTDIYHAKYGWKMEILQFFIMERINQKTLIALSQDCRLFLENSDIENYLATFDMNRTKVQLLCISQKCFDVSEKVCPIQGVYSDLGGFIDQNESIHISYSDIATKITREKSVILFGRGHDCDMIINELHKTDSEDKINFIFDSNINFAGTLYRGINVKYPTRKKISEVRGKIVIASSNYEDEICKFLLENGFDERNIIKIFN